MKGKNFGFRCYISARKSNINCFRLSFLSQQTLRFGNCQMEQNVIGSFVIDNIILMRFQASHKELYRSPENTMIILHVHL